MGAAVGLAMPNLLASATFALPYEQTSTGGGIVSMSRQIGLMLGACWSASSGRLRRRSAPSRPPGPWSALHRCSRPAYQQESDDLTQASGLTA